jgi:hypothetical protein
VCVFAPCVCLSLFFSSLVPVVCPECSCSKANRVDRLRSCGLRKRTRVSSPSLNSARAMHRPWREHHSACSQQRMCTPPLHISLAHQCTTHRDYGFDFPSSRSGFTGLSPQSCTSVISTIHESTPSPAALLILAQTSQPCCLNELCQCRDVACCSAPRPEHTSTDG